MKGCWRLSVPRYHRGISTWFFPRGSIDSAILDHDHSISVLGLVLWV